MANSTELYIGGLLAEKKSAWMRSARVSGKPFAEWVIEALDNACIDTEPEWADGLSERATIALLGAGFDSRDALAAAIDEGRDEELIALPNFGRRCLAEVKTWLEE